MGLVRDKANELLETWLQVPRWPAYWVSALGRVYSEHSGRLLTPYTNETDDYLVVKLYRNGDSKQVYVHWLVATCFIERGSLSGKVVHHKDGDAFNNSVSNLEVLTEEEHIEKHERDRIENDPAALSEDERNSGVLEQKEAAPF
jgi:hypothetical protein